MPGHLINKRKFCLQVLLCSLVLLCFWPLEAEAKNSKPLNKGSLDNRRVVTIIDDLKRVRKIPCPIKKMIVLSAPAVEVSWALGKGHLIVARSQWATWPPLMAKLPCIGRLPQPNRELIWELKPDVIIADGHFIKSASLMEKMGCPVVFLSAVYLNDIPGLIDKMGLLLGATKKSSELKDFVQGYIRLLDSRVAGLKKEQKPRVFHGSNGQLYFTSSSKYGRRVVDYAGADNIADSLPLTWQRVSPEWIIQEDPDYMILSPALGRYQYIIPDESLMKTLWQNAKNRPGIRKIRLGREKRFYLLNSRLGYGLRSFLGSLYLVKIFHPRLFQDLEPKKIHSAFLKRFFGLNLAGSYMYP